MRQTTPMAPMNEPLDTFIQLNGRIYSFVACASMSTYRSSLHRLSKSDSTSPFLDLQSDMYSTFPYSHLDWRFSKDLETFP
jgi:hypothetical protein